MRSIGPFTNKCMDYFMDEIKKENRKDELRNHVVQPCIEYIYADIHSKMYPWFIGVIVFNSLMFLIMCVILIMVTKGQLRLKKS